MRRLSPSTVFALLLAILFAAFAVPAARAQTVLTGSHDYSPIGFTASGPGAFVVPADTADGPAATFSNNLYTGLSANKAAVLTINGGQFNFNRYVSGSTTTGEGLYVSSSTVTVNTGQFNGNYFAGCLADSGSTVIINGGQFDANTQYGFWPYRATSVLVSGGQFNHNQDGFALAFCPAVAITGGQFVGNSTADIVVNTSTVDIYGQFTGVATGQNMTLPAGSGTFSGTLQNAPLPQIIRYSNSGGMIVLHDAPLQTAVVVPVSLSFSPAYGVAGQPLNGTVTLSAPAPPGGLPLALTTNNAAAGTALVPEGQTTAAVSLVLPTSLSGRQVTVAAIAHDWSAECAVTVNTTAPTPIIYSPSSVVAGGPDFTLTLTGTSFTPTCVAQWNNTNLVTTYISPTQIAAVVPAALTANASLNRIGVTDTATASTGYGPSFVVASPVPTLASLSPSTAAAGSAALAITVTGTGFTKASYNGGGYPLSPSAVQWNGQYLFTTFVSPTQLTAAVPASCLANMGTAWVTVVNPSNAGGTMSPGIGGGTSGALTFTITTPPDTTAPVTTAALASTGNSNSWYNSAVQVTLSATDTQSGVANTFYTLDAGPIQTYMAPLVIGTDGTHKLAFWSADKAGNVEAINTKTVKIDATPPTLVFGTPTPAPNAAGWNNTVVTIPYIAADALSGVFNIYPYGNGSVSFESGGAGQTANITVVDFAVNNATFTSPAVNIDLTAPLTTASVTGATVTLSASDALSGVASTVYTVDGGSPQMYSAPFTVTGNGTHSVSFFSTDVAGNTEAAHALTVNTDTMPPITTASLSGRAGANSWYTSMVMVTLSATDTGSGVASTSYTIDGGSPHTYLAPFAVSGDGSHTITFGSVDNAGNAEATNTQSVKIDATPPVTTGTVNGSLLTLTPNDAASGVAQTKFTLNGGAAQVYSAPIALYGTGNQSSTVTFWSVDNAGNIEAVQSLTSKPYTPAVFGLSPSYTTAGSPALTLTVSGTNFLQSSIIKWKGINQPTTFVSGTMLTAVIPASLLAAAGTAPVSVTTPAVGTSGTLTFTIYAPPLPTINSFSPASVKAGSAAFTLTVMGTGFAPGSVVKWNGAAQPTTFVSETVVTAAIPASLLKKAGTIQVTATTPVAGTSYAVAFTITP